jgi:hypothetical protein
MGHLYQDYRKARFLLCHSSYRRGVPSFQSKLVDGQADRACRGDICQYGLDDGVQGECGCHVLSSGYIVWK